MPIESHRQFLTNGTYARAAGVSGFGASGKSHAAVLQTRRRFLRTAAFVGVAGMLPLLAARAAEPAPEIETQPPGYSLGCDREDNRDCGSATLPPCGLRRIAMPHPTVAEHWHFFGFVCRSMSLPHAPKKGGS